MCYVYLIVFCNNKKRKRLIEKLKRFDVYLSNYQSLNSFHFTFNRLSQNFISIPQSIPNSFLYINPPFRSFVNPKILRTSPTPRLHECVISKILKQVKYFILLDITALKIELILFFNNKRISVYLCSTTKKTMTSSRKRSP